MAGKVAVIGAGSWGTGLACVLSAGGPVTLWSREEEICDTILRTRHNPRYLADVALPAGVEVTTDLNDAVQNAEIVLMAVPAKGMETSARAVSAVLRTQARQGPEAPLVLSGAKGLDPSTGRLMSQVLSAVFGDRAAIGALSGPNIATEVARGLPTATVVAGRDGPRLAAAQSRISGTSFRAYTNDDLVGVEVGGAMKNVIAIAAGIGDGIRAGDNAKAAIMTRGLVEMSRLGVAMGGNARTFAGLTGLGDLIVTCSSPHSRNRALGIGIGQGRSLAEMEASMTMVAEGVNTTREALRLASECEVELPITEAVAQVLFEGADPLATAAGLMMRTGRGEREGLGI